MHKRMEMQHTILAITFICEIIFLLQLSLPHTDRGVQHRKLRAIWVHLIYEATIEIISE